MGWPMYLDSISGVRPGNQASQRAQYQIQDEILRAIQMMSCPCGSIKNTQALKQEPCVDSTSRPAEMHQRSCRRIGPKALVVAHLNPSRTLANSNLPMWSGEREQRISDGLNSSFTGAWLDKIVWILPRACQEGRMWKSFSALSQCQPPTSDCIRLNV